MGDVPFLNLSYSNGTGILTKVTTPDWQTITVPETMLCTCN